MYRNHRFVLPLVFLLSLILNLNISCTGNHTYQGEVESSSSILVRPGDDIQAVLDSGKDVLLEKGEIYEITETLVYRYPGQKISTKDAVYISDYGTLRIACPDLMMLVDGARKDNIVLKNVLLDGNRYRLSTVDKEDEVGGGGQPPLVFFGDEGAVGQKALNNVFMNTRTWATLKVHEGAQNCVVEGNMIIGAGVDPRGNGREETEVPFAWGDSISVAAHNTLVRDNLMIDPTDVGIVFYGAPGSIAEDNVVACISRESLGGINLVDGFLWQMEDGADGRERYSYEGTVVRNNYIDSFGARIHMSIPMGTGVWVPHLKEKTLVGGSVYGNVVAGGAAGYGLVMNGLEGWRVYDNESIANHSGIGEGLPGDPPDEPGPFLFNPDRVTDSVLQEDFVVSERHLLHLLRCNHGDTNELGYRIYEYGEYEVRAVVRAAYLEMLGRRPSQKEMEDTIDWLQESQEKADTLRRKLMASDEFKENFGEVDPADLHFYRIDLWMDILDNVQRDYYSEDGQMPDAKALYMEALDRLDRSEVQQADASTLHNSIMAGYQGWYRAPGDGTGLPWVHYRGRNLVLHDGNCGIEYWPDMSEMDQDEKYLPHKFFYPDGSPAHVFSNANPKTTNRHFKWMHDYGIDGVFVQRFVMEVTVDWDQEAKLSRESFNHVLNLARQGANQYGRTYAVMYDLTSMPADYIDNVKRDWKYLVDIMGITNDPDDKAYQHHNGAPVVAIWGVGFGDNREYTFEETAELIDFFKNDPRYGGNTVMVGVPTYWREQGRDASNDDRFLELYKDVDIISPWTVGRFSSIDAAINYAETTAAGDMEWCKEHGVEYMPVSFPGFGWKNLTGTRNYISREDGRFLWAQHHALMDNGATMIYQAMFDELDEGTQIFKVTNTPPEGESEFLTYEGLPTDHYLWQVGKATKMLRGEIELTDRIPAREGHCEANERIASGYEED